jgi:hypothetical protein
VYRVADNRTSSRQAYRLASKARTLYTSRRVNATEDSVMNSSRFASAVQGLCTTIIICSLATLSLSCGCKKKSPADKPTEDVEELLRGSSLYGHLTADARDPIFCAASYIRRAGGPDTPGPATTVTLEEWQAHGKRLLEWIRKHDADRVRSLVEGFPDFVHRWSPFFFPEGADDLHEAEEGPE